MSCLLAGKRKASRRCFSFCWKQLLVPGVFCLLAGICACGGVFQSQTMEAFRRTVRYHALGDSITFGYSLSSPATQAYPVLVASHERIAADHFFNHAIPGDQACDVPTRQIFPAAIQPSSAERNIYSLLIGTNDVNVKGTGEYEQVFKLCHQASIAWLAVPDKIAATDPSVVTSGAGRMDAAGNWNAWTIGAAGASITFTLTTTQNGPIYAWFRIDDGSTAASRYLLDGVELGSLQAGRSPAIATQNGTTHSLGFLRIPDVAAGTHTLKFMQRGAAGFSVVAVGAPPAHSEGYRPIVLVGAIPYQMHVGYAGSCTISDAPCQQYNADIRADVNLFAADGLDVRLFNPRGFLSGAPVGMSDPVHPNAMGQYEISRAVESAWMCGSSAFCPMVKAF